LHPVGTTGQESLLRLIKIFEWNHGAHVICCATIIYTERDWNICVINIRYIKVNCGKPGLIIAIGKVLSIINIDIIYIKFYQLGWGVVLVRRTGCSRPACITAADIAQPKIVRHRNLILRCLRQIGIEFVNICRKD